MFTILHKTQRGAMKKYFFLNLKRFDILPESGGVNSIATPESWGAKIAGEITEKLSASAIISDGAASSADGNEFPVFLPEAHIIPAVSALSTTEAAACKIKPEIGCQSVHWADTSKGGNFGAFTTMRTANSMKQLGCTWTIIAHSEERRAKMEMMTQAGASPEAAKAAMNAFFAKEVACAQAAGLKVLFCIGENSEEVPHRREVLQSQLSALDSADKSNIVLGYEPVWAIGPGKTPPTAEQIRETTIEVKSILDLPVVYGGGLKMENAKAIGEIKELAGGLIALTRFTGTIGFYPNEYVEIIETYIKG